jgi:hypothetical protein
MSKDYTQLPPHLMRRSDRQVEDEDWIRAYLHRAAYGALATVHDGQPFINTNLYVYDEVRHAIYLHTARVGRTRGNVEADARVCFSISDIGRLLPAGEALEFSVEYSGVTIFGRACIVEGEEAAAALQLLLDKYAPHLRPGRDYRGVTEDELARTSVFKIEIDSWSGKRKIAAADFPGAFTFPIEQP